MNKTAVIICQNTFIIPKHWKNHHFVGVEKGVLLLKTQSVKWLFSIGDFDSVSETEWKNIKNTSNLIKLKRDKDITDLEAAIIKLKKLGYQKIKAVVTGDRYDHFLHQIGLIIKYSIELYSCKSKILLAKKEQVIKRQKYFYISFFAMESTIFSATNLKWPLVNFEMNLKKFTNLSNEFMTNESKITVSKGKLFVILSKSNNF